MKCLNTLKYGSPAKNKYYFDLYCSTVDFLNKVHTTLRVLSKDLTTLRDMLCVHHSATFAMTTNLLLSKQYSDKTFNF